MQLIQGIFFAILILAIALLLDWLIQLSMKWLHSWGERRLNRRLRSGYALLLPAGQFLLRLCLWGLAISFGFGQIPLLRPLVKLLGSVIQQIPQLWFEATNFRLELEQGKGISLNTLITVIGVTILIFFAANILSRWLKQRVLSKTSINRGSQEAISAFLTYAISFFGFIILLQSVGLNLSSLTVFAGVLGIGFAFGMQQLGNNYVSGLTLLFQQQLRVGDFVNFEGVSGTIESISMQSTIIRTQDCHHVMIPNHRFFDNYVVNWSYSSPECRIHIPVRVAYGTDTILVTETLLASARMEPRVLSYPAPTVWFKQFGPSSLKFDLLVWINQPQDVEPIKSALNYLIEQELRRRNISIPFPQLDLWVRNSEALPSHPVDSAQSSKNTQLAKAATSHVSPFAPMKPRTLRHLLRQVSYFEHCTNAQLLVLIEQGFRQFYEVSQIIFKEKDPGECFYVILSGSVEVYSETLDQVLATLSVGDFFGEISLFTGTPRSATVRALEESTLFVVNRRALQSLLQEYSDLAESIARSLSQRKQILEELGLVNDDLNALNNNDPIYRIRNHLKSLFGI